MVAIKKRRRRKQGDVTTFCVAFVGSLAVFVVLVVLFSSDAEKASPTTAAGQFKSFGEQLGASKVSRSDAVSGSHDHEVNEEKGKDHGTSGSEGGMKSSGHRSHTTDRAFVAEYQYQRENPIFRLRFLPDWSSKAVSKFGSTKSCHYFAEDRRTRLWNSEKCNNATPKLVAYNGATFERFWCGQTIAPKTAIEIKKSACLNDPVTIFSGTGAEAPLDGEGMPPIVVRGSPTSKSATEQVHCSVPCHFEKKFTSYERYIENTPWKIHFTLDDPVKNVHAKVEPTAHRNNLYYATTSFKASVPRTYFQFEEYDIFAPAVKYDEVQKSGSYLVDSMCNSHFTKRNRWADAVKNRIETHFYASCAHTTNAKNLDIRKKEDRIKLMSNHLFALAFEFGDAKDHITSLVWEALSAGTLPIILGAGNIDTHLPAHSFVSTSGLQHWDDLGHRVASIVQNKTAWESYHKFRTDPEARKKFEAKYSFSRIPDTCRLCKWAYAKKYGLGWNHKGQEIKTTHLSRTLELGGNKLAVKPFSESWVSSRGDTIIGADLNGDGKSITVTETSIEKLIDRSIQYHDNVFDISFTNFGSESPQNDLIMRMKLPVENFEGSFFHHPHTIIETVRGASCSSIAIQDEYSKVIVVSNWQTEIVSGEEGVIDVVVHGGESINYGKDIHRQIRVIIEDMSELHDKSTEFYPSSFAKQMVQDFIDPLELYYFE